MLLPPVGIRNLRISCTTYLTFLARWGSLLLLAVGLSACGSSPSTIPLPPASATLISATQAFFTKDGHPLLSLHGLALSLQSSHKVADCRNDSQQLTKTLSQIPSSDQVPDMVLQQLFVDEAVQVSRTLAACVNGGIPSNQSLSLQEVSSTVALRLKQDGVHT